MSIVVTIAGVDRTKSIQLDSLKIKNILTRKRDTCEFKFVPSAGLTPTLGQEIVVTLDGSKVFGGVITAAEQVADAFSVLIWRVEGQDYSRLLDRRLVAESYQNMTVNDIIADLATTYFPTGFTTTNVDCSIVISSVKFNYLTLSKVLEELADTVGYDWYVDYDKDVHFFSKLANSAPVDIEDDNGTVIYDSLIIRRDNSQVRNSIIVRGGEYLGDSFTGEWEGNGVDYVVPLPYRFTDFRASLTGGDLSIGVDYINDENDYHALYNFQEKVLKFPVSKIPSIGAVLRYSGRPHLPVIVKLKSTPDIGTMSAAEGGDGVYEYLIVDKTIVTKEAARTRARAEISAYATTLSEGEFVTLTAGIRSGQRIKIYSVSRGIDEYFIVNQVTLVQFDTGSFAYSVSLVTTKSFDLIDLLMRLTLAGTKNIEIGENEQIEIVQTLDDTLSAVDTLGTFSASPGVAYRWSPSSQDGQWDFATWS